MNKGSFVKSVDVKLWEELKTTLITLTRAKSIEI